MNFRKKYFLLTIIFSSLLFRCGGQGEETENAMKANVEIGSPVFKNLTEYLTLNGNTTFIKKEIVRAAFQGYIQKTFKTIGDKINPGDPLFTIKTKEASAVDSSSLNFIGEVTIKTKSSGVLTQIDYNTGDYVSDGEHIAVISNPSSLKIILNVPYQYVSSIHLNGGCAIVLPEGKIINGIISRKIPNVDAEAQTQTFMVDIPQSESLPENLNVIVKIPLKVFSNSAVLPKPAIMSSDVLDEFWIMKLINDSTAVKVNIERGIEDGEMVQVLSPKLNNEDKIVFVGAYGLPDTANVKIGK